MLALQRLGRSMFGLALRDAAVALGRLASPAFSAALLASAIGFVSAGQDPPPDDGEVSDLVLQS